MTRGLRATARVAPTGKTLLGERETRHRSMVLMDGVRFLHSLQGGQVGRNDVLFQRREVGACRIVVEKGGDHQAEPY